MNGIGCATERPKQDAKGWLLGEALDGTGARHHGRLLACNQNKGDCSMPWICCAASDRSGSGGQDCLAGMQAELGHSG